VAVTYDRCLQKQLQTNISAAIRSAICDLIELCSDSSCLCAKVAVLKSVRMISSATRRCSALGHAPAKRLLASTRRGSALQPFTPGQLSSSSNMADISSARESELREPLKPAAAFAEGAAYPAGAPAGRASCSKHCNWCMLQSIASIRLHQCGSTPIQAVPLLLLFLHTVHRCISFWLHVPVTSSRTPDAPELQHLVYPASQCMIACTVHACPTLPNRLMLSSTMLT
jgi:hypothetical protein